MKCFMQEEENYFKKKQDYLIENKKKIFLNKFNLKPDFHLPIKMSNVTDKVEMTENENSIPDSEKKKIETKDSEKRIFVQLIDGEGEFT